VGEVIQVVLASVLRATTEKKVVKFLVKKSAARQNPGYAYEGVSPPNQLLGSLGRPGRQRIGAYLRHTEHFGYRENNVTLASFSR